MSEIRDSGFKSYIDDTHLENINLNDVQRTKLKDGETVVCEASNVMLYTPLTDRKKGTIGILTVTTFKLSFACAEIESNLNECYQHNLLLAPFEVCLSSIDHIYQINERSRKKLSPGHNVSGKVKEIAIICKNMKVLEFTFKYGDKGNGKNVLNALLHHAYPKRHALLFAYEYREPYYNKQNYKEARFFRCKDDWNKELERTKCQNWRLSVANMNYQLSPNLTTFIIVPQSATDAMITTAVQHFRNATSPTWVWGSSKGAALVRMADLLPAITDRTQENIMLEHIRRSHPEKKQPHIIDLTKDCPSPKEIQTSYLKLRDLCAPDSTKTFKSQDFKFYGLLDSTKWLQYVSMCLTKAAEAADRIHQHNSTVVLQEGNGHDMNCVISSLTQILLDPFWRTKFGFQSLIQKDWVAMGHPFANRLGHILSSDTEESPLLLLFLDCVWQLLQQFPRAFQISETYLTTLWDSAHISVFETFLFNCEHDRFMAGQGSTGIALRSVWDWSEQFLEKDILFFCNPLYDDLFKERLQPNTNVSGMDVWIQCYFRWLPNLEISNGGNPQIDLCMRIITAEICQLRQSIPGEMNGKIKHTKEEHLDLLKKVNSFFPFSYNKQNTGELPENILLTGDVLETQSILNLNND